MDLELIKHHHIDLFAYCLKPVKLKFNILSFKRINKKLMNAIKLYFGITLSCSHVLTKTKRNKGFLFCEIINTFAILLKTSDFQRQFRFLKKLLM